MLLIPSISLLQLATIQVSNILGQSTFVPYNLLSKLVSSTRRLAAVVVVAVNPSSVGVPLALPSQLTNDSLYPVVASACLLLSYNRRL